MTYRECYLFGCQELKEAGIAEYELDSRLLLEDICNSDYNTLILDGNRIVDEADRKRFEEAIGKRKTHIPLQHITGKQDFCGLTFQVNEYVLIPRQDTEILVEEALAHLKPGMHILDMCTGSGCILISLLVLGKGKNVTGVGADLSVEALKVANHNAEVLLGACEFRKSDLFSAFYSGEKSNKHNGCGTLEQFDMIVSNPPYIATKEIDELMPEVRIHEPLMALDGKEDGLFFYRRIVNEAGDFLKEGGYLLLEIGYDQGPAVSEMMQQNGYQDVNIKKDYAGLNRVVFGRKGKKNV
ncbi:MAG: peptide chain release factor N(5)-glutamine methyltransferase [Lachnospiraceae bacterium]